MPKHNSELVEKMQSIGYLTLADAGRRAGCEPNTIGDWAASGTVRSLKHGMFVFVRAADVNRMKTSEPDRLAKIASVGAGRGGGGKLQEIIHQAIREAVPEIVREVGEVVRQVLRDELGATDAGAPPSIRAV